jgi:hypothetical protein
MTSPQPKPNPALDPPFLVAQLATTSAGRTLHIVSGDLYPVNRAYSMCGRKMARLPAQQARKRVYCQECLRRWDEPRCPCMPEANPYVSDGPDLVLNHESTCKFHPEYDGPL